MVHIEFGDYYLMIPGSDDGIGAWVPLSEEQRRGEECIDCGRSVYGSAYGRFLGTCEAGKVYVCQACYEQRLMDHIDYYRPQS